MKAASRVSLVSLWAAWSMMILAGCSLEDYELVKSHEVPGWYHDAKFGVMIHWGPSSVPGWAPVEDVDPGNLFAWDYFLNNPYSEWYWNSLKIPGSPTRRYHEETYGADYAYDRFGDTFREASEAFDFADWADLFAYAGARYTVLITKHHDGYLLWPSEYENPHRVGWQSERDLVGDLSAAVRERGMKMGVYYSGGLDWTFTEEKVITHFLNLFGSVPQGEAYAAYAENHWRELIDRYEPDLLWNDIALPPEIDRWRLWADYYRRVPEGVVNDRWANNLLEQAHYLAIIDGVEEISPFYHFDFFTPEYQLLTEARVLKFEVCRGTGYSFGYNRQEEVYTDHLLSPKELVETLVDIVSKNGNMLLGIGPRADGSIPESQRLVLEELGRWLACNGAAIYGTRPWVVAEGRADGGQVRVRFTRAQNGSALYAILLDRPANVMVNLEGLQLADGASIRLLGHEGDPLSWSNTPDGLQLAFPAEVLDSHAYALEISPEPLWFTDSAGERGVARSGSRLLR